ncbi:MAG: hypothetical protein AAF587_33470 [Bacteroidota bacterium]
MLSLFACKDSPVPVERMAFVYDSLYQIDLPNNLYKGYDMHDYASLQYYDTLMGVYVLGIEDAKDNLGEIKRKRLKLYSYYAFVEHAVFLDVDSTILVSEQLFSSGKNLEVLAGDYHTLNKDWENVPIFYRIAIFESPEYFFQLVTWMPYEIHCDFMPWIDTMMTSFHFIPHEERNVAGLR